MAVTLLSQPTSPNVTGTKLLYQVSGSDISHPQYSYVMDVYLSGSTELLVRQYQVPNPDGTAEFQPSPIFNSYLSYDNYWKINQLYVLDPSGPSSYVGNPTNAVKTFNVKFGEAYSTSISSSVTVYPGSSDNYLQVFPGTLDPSQNNLLNDGYNFRTASFGISNGPRSNLLTNYPTQNFGSGWLEDTQFFTKEDYATVTQYNNANSFPSIANVQVRGFLNTGDSRTQVFIESLTPGAFSNEFYNQAFFTWGVGPKNLSNVYNTNESRYVIREYIESGSVNEIDVNLPGLDETRYFIRDNVFNNRVFQSDSDPTIEATSEEDSLRVPLNTEYIQLAFINQFGFYDFYDIYQPLKRKTKVDRENVSLPKVDYSSRISNYSIERGGETSYNTEINDTYTITTDWLGKTIANYLEEIFDSPEVYIRQGTNYVPIVITSTSYQHNNDEGRNKLFQYTIEFAPSNGRDLFSEEYSAPSASFQTFKHIFNCDDLPSTTAVRVDDDMNLGRYTLPPYSKEWRISEDTQNVRLEPTGSVTQQQGFFYTTSGITFSPRYRTGGFGTTFDDNVKVDITITGDGNTIFTTSSVFANPSTRNLDLTPFTASFTGSYNEIIYSSSLTRYPTAPVLSPTWYYDSQQILATSAWDDTLTTGRNFPGQGQPGTGATRINYFTSQSRGPYTGNWWNVDPDFSPLPVLPNGVWTNGNNGSAAGLTGSNYTLQSWVYINEFSEVDGSTPRSCFFTLSGDQQIGTANGTRVSVGSRQSGSVNILSISTDTWNLATVEETFPSQIIETGSWYQISLVQDGTNFNDFKVYVNNQTAFYSPTASVNMDISGSYQFDAGTDDNDKVLSGSIANVICYATSSLTQEQIAQNYNNINNYLLI